MVKRVVASLVVVGTLAIGSADTAMAASGPNCTNAPAVIARLQAEEAQVAAVLATLQGGITHGRHEAFRVHRQIAFLTRVEARLVARVTRLQARCPSGGNTGGGTDSVN